jgi:hypothetical protein
MTSEKPDPDPTLEGQSHEKVGEMSVWDDSLDPIQESLQAFKIF